MQSFKKVYIKIINIIDFIISLLLIKIIHLKKVKLREKTLLLIRLDSIGDYVLFRNFLSTIKNNSKYSDYNITLCGNVIWKDLAETFDSNNINSFIWIDRKKYRLNPFYKIEVFRNIYRNGFEVAIETLYTREILYGDMIIKASKANQRIGSSGSPESYTFWKRKLLTDKYYTNLIQLSERNIFEFYRNKEFIEKLLGEKSYIEKPSIDVSSIKFILPIQNPFIVIFPGAQEKSRRWSINKFISVINYLLNNFNYHICIAGSRYDSSLASEIISTIKNDRIMDFTGQTTLVELSKLISLARLLITNDTSAAHIAVSVNTPFICISKGKHFGRFNPYPIEMNAEAIYLYPNYIENNLTNHEQLAQEFRFDSNLNINEVTSEKVIKIIDKLLN